MTDTANEARKSFQDALDELRIDVIRLAALTTEAIGAGTQALLDADLAAAEQVIENDDDGRRPHPHDRGQLLPAPRSPAAHGDRPATSLVTSAHRSTSSNASADLMVNVAKTTRRLYPHSLDPKLRGIIEQMGSQAATRPASRSTPSPIRIRTGRPALADMDDRMDELTKSLFRHILAGRAAPTRSQCCSRCRWRWWAATTNGSPTTR